MDRRRRSREEPRKGWRDVWAWKDESRRHAMAFWAGVAAIVLLVEYALAELFLGGTPSAEAQLARLDTIAPVEVVVDQVADPGELEKPLGMGSARAGISLRAVGEVDRVHTEDGERRAAEGSTLLAFRVGDWPCEIKPCESWDSLEPQVLVDDETRDLPAGGDTFVVVLPPGTEQVVLSIDADGFRQSLPLAGDVEPDTIALLADRDRPGRISLGRSFVLEERTSVPLSDGAGGLTDFFRRDVQVAYAERRFFLDGTTPAGPREVFLVVEATYAYQGRAGRYVFAPDDLAFVAPDGTRYAARDLDPTEEKVLLGFEIPERLRAGKIVFGGVRERTSSTGVPYTSTLGEWSVPVDLG